MAVNRTQYIAEKRSLLQLAGLRHGEQTCQGDFALGAAVAIRDLANEHEQAHGALADIVGWLHSLVFDERKQLVPMHVECARQIAHVAVVTVQVLLRQTADPLLNRGRFTRLNPSWPLHS